MKGRILPEIPFIFFGPQDLTVSVQKSPLADIVNLNVHHYMAEADLSHGCHHTGMPTYWAVAPEGDESKVEYKIGPTRVWIIDQANGAGILEFNGQGLVFLENKCANIERQMSTLGARIEGQKARTAAESTEVALMRSRGETSTLNEVLDTAEEGLTRAIQLWVLWHGRDPSGVKVRLNRDFVEERLQYRDQLALERWVKLGIIKPEIALQALHEGDVLPGRIEADDLVDVPGLPVARIKTLLEAMLVKQGLPPKPAGVPARPGQSRPQDGDE